VRRVLGVLEDILSKKGGTEPCLVGDRITYADLAWVPWNHRLDAILGVPKDKMFEGFPTVQAWHERMIARPSWIKASELRIKCMDEQGLDENGMFRRNISCLNIFSTNVLCHEYLLSVGLTPSTRYAEGHHQLPGIPEQDCGG
jgi:hypothetical protein